MIQIITYQIGQKKTIIWAFQEAVKNARDTVLVFPEQEHCDLSKELALDVFQNPIHEEVEEKSASFYFGIGSSENIGGRAIWVFTTEPMPRKTVDRVNNAHHLKLDLKAVDAIELPTSSPT